MNLLNWFRKPRVKTYPQEKLVHRAIKEIYAKAEQCAGDPFADARAKGALPEKFEYGMNCFVDRIFEESGAEVAQQTYEEIKKAGCYEIRDPNRSFDLGGIPVLFGVSPTGGISAHNRAINVIRKRRKMLPDDVVRNEILADKSIFLQKLKEETELDYACRLGMLSTGFQGKSIKLSRKGRSPLADKLGLYSKIIQELTPAKTRPISDVETYALLLGGGVVEKITPDEEKEFYEFLLRIGPDFWPMMWDGFLKHFQDSFSTVTGPEVMRGIAHLTDEFEKAAGVPPVPEAKRRDPYFIGSEECSGIWKEIWGKVSEKGKARGLPKDALLIVSFTIFLKAFGCQGPIEDIAKTAEWPSLKFLFYKLVEETMVDDKAWMRAFAKEQKRKEKSGK